MFNYRAANNITSKYRYILIEYCIYLLYSYKSTASKLYRYHKKYRNQENIVKGYIIKNTKVILDQQ